MTPWQHSLSSVIGNRRYYNRQILSDLTDKKLLLYFIQQDSQIVSSQIYWNN
jgi:hypothetical protein